MKQNKTQKTNESVVLFLSSITEEQKQKDSYTLLEVMREITQADPHLWGTSIIGFGEYHYKYKTGREGDWFLAGFSPRKQALTLYLMCDLSHDGLDFEGLGKYKLGKGCLYIKRLTDINIEVLKKIIKDSIRIIKEKYS
ncbi:MAG: DUF1801 domain-containing protein [Flavobacteriaceae bacterium]